MIMTVSLKRTLKDIKDPGGHSGDSCQIPILAWDRNVIASSKDPKDRPIQQTFTE